MQLSPSGRSELRSCPLVLSSGCVKSFIRSLASLPVRLDRSSKLCGRSFSSLQEWEKSSDQRGDTSADLKETQENLKLAPQLKVEMPEKFKQIIDLREAD